MKTCVTTRIVLVVLTLAFCVAPHAAPLPADAQEVHLGVATCASGVCHGSVRERSTTRILQNEFVVWSKLDKHRNAYNILLSADSQRIAKNLGLENAHEAPVCLDCHADNVDVSKRGQRFQISDGIGCEACHGGGEKYLSNHTDPARHHQDNIESGMYPTDRLEERAALCFSCHIGNEDRIASHEIMGAGHPRLTFELDTFGILQPSHYVLDDDYKKAKWSADSMTVWTLGQIEAGYQTLDLIAAHLDGSQRFPELSLFDCHACHHPMSDQRWSAEGRFQQPPGTVRLNDVGFVMLYPIAKGATPALVAELTTGVDKLHAAVAGKGPVTGAIASLRVTLDSLKNSVGTRGPNPSMLLDEILDMGMRGEFKDYIAAEQAVMAIDMLLNQTRTREKNGSWLDDLYTAVEDEDAYDHFEFSDLFSRGPER